MKGSKKLECYITLGCKGLTGTNTQACNSLKIITVIKRSMVPAQVLEGHGDWIPSDRVSSDWVGITECCLGTQPRFFSES